MKTFVLACLCAALVAALAAPAHSAPTLSPGCIEANHPQYDGDYSVGTIDEFAPGEVLTITATGASNQTEAFSLLDLRSAPGLLATGSIPGSVTYTIPTTGQLIRWGIVVGFASWIVSCEAPAPPPPPPPPTLEDVRDELAGLVEDNPGTPLADKAEDAAKQLEEALSELARPAPDVAGVLGRLEGAAGDLEALVSDELVTEEDGEALLDVVVAAARELASDAIAGAEGGDAGKLADANAALLQGDALRDEGRYKDAVAKYKDAYAVAAGA
jgi:hypothetical protein